MLCSSAERMISSWYVLGGTPSGYTQYLAMFLQGGRTRPEDHCHPPPPEHEHPDVVPHSHAPELKKLQDKIPPFSDVTTEITQILRGKLGLLSSQLV